MDKPKQKMTLN